MSGPSRVYLAQLSSVAVIGPDGESVGKIRDIVAGLRVGKTPPRLLGLVIELVTRRRIFVPMLRVNSFEPNAVTLTTGSVNLRHFHQRTNEVLVLGQMLDARVTLADGSVATVMDTAMEQSRTRDWMLTKLAVRPVSKGWGRKGAMQIVAWEDTTGLGMGGEPQEAHQLVALYDGMRAADVANAMKDLPRKRRLEVVDALNDDRLADVLEELPEEDQKELLGHLDEERAADVLEAMDPDDAADLLGELSEVDKNRLLELMEPEESEPVRRLLEYSPYTAGGLMTPEPIILNHDATIAEALARIRNPDLTPALASMVFVSRPPSQTPTGRYLGCVHLQRLLREPPSELVAGALDTDLVTLSPDAPLSEVTRYFATYNLVCAPVVDDQEHLLGAVTVDDVLDHVLPENWRDELHHHDRATASE